MMVATRGRCSYTLGDLVGRRTVAAGDKAWGSAAMRGTPRASRERGSRGSSSRQPLQAAVLETPAVLVANSCKAGMAVGIVDSSCKVLVGNRFLALAAEDDEVAEAAAAEVVGSASAELDVTLEVEKGKEKLKAAEALSRAVLLQDLAGIDAIEWFVDSRGGRSCAYHATMAMRASLVEQLAVLEAASL